MTRTAAIHARREELLTVKEFAEVARQTVDSVYKRVARGQQPGAIRIGGEIRIDMAAACVPLSNLSKLS